MKVDIETGYQPRSWQYRVHAQLKRFSVLVIHRRGGKTVLAINTQVDAALRCTLHNGRFGYIAPFLKQAKAVAWDYLKHYTKDIPGCRVNETELSVTLPNGARVRLYGADNADAIRGDYFDGVVLDEVAQMRPWVWGEIIRPMLMDRNGWALFIGTPKGINLFSELYYKAMQDPEWYTEILTCYDTDALAPGEIEKAKQEMTEAQFRQEMLCDFSASSDDVLIPIDEAVECSQRHLRKDQYDFAAKVLGVDVARYGDDNSVVFPRQGLAAFMPKAYQGLDNMAVADRVAMAWDKWEADACFIDGGRGEGVIDRLIQLGYHPQEVLFNQTPLNPRFMDRRAEMWSAMADWLRSGAAIPNLPRLLQDLSLPTFTYKNARGKFQLQSKDEIRTGGLPSTDYADALALTFAAPVMPKVNAREMAYRQQVHAGELAPNVVDEYDPFGG